MARLKDNLTRLVNNRRSVSRLRRIFVQEQSGAAIVEMAMSSTILFAMFFGLFQMTMASYTYQYVSDAAREGTRWAIVRGSSCATNTPNLDHCGATSSDVQTYIKGLGYPGLNGSNLSAAATWYSPSTSTPTTWTLCSSGTCNYPGNLVKVVVTYSYRFSVPFVMSRTMNIQSSSQMVIAQ
jgi:Flp pilus assembly protein TadG